MTIAPARLNPDPFDCPECQQRKHQNCVGWALDDERDVLVPCECQAGGHA